MNRKTIVLILGITIGLITATILVLNSVLGSKPPDFEPYTTLGPSSTVRVTGAVYPWKNEPIAGRHIVLCELDDKTSESYACRVTSFAAITDIDGRFEIDNVSPGTYLVFYDSGLVDFAQGLRSWQDQVIYVGDHRWTMDNLFSAETDGTFAICGGIYDFYYNYIPYTLGASGSPFMVAHDVESAVAYEGTMANPFPEEVFAPIVVQVVQGYSSNIEFTILSCKQ